MEELENEENIENQEYRGHHKELKRGFYISNMFQDWFLDYASYVILERAVPHELDGLKPVQRRILHAMKRLDDGRYNKVANIIGYTMQYHPHGDASIGDALVQLGQKNLLIDMQGNWGNIYTGDSAAAPRYIEARLSKFAQEVVFNPKTTVWKLSYDGRNKEPVQLPVKFPLLLVQGGEGIAVGLSSKILPHNFNEVIDAAIAHLKGENFELFPDFPTGGMIDVSKYEDGQRGGRVRVRAKIDKIDKRTLVISDLPYGKNTGTLIDSILAANDKGKIKIKKIDDNTSDKVEIMIHLPSGVSSDKTIDALYAFTDCEISISPNAAVIGSEKPHFRNVSELLRISTDSTLHLLKLELEIRKNELQEAWHMSSLEKIFIENRIYNQIEECETWNEIIETIDKGLEPFKKLLFRDVTVEDITKLTEIRIKRISRYDAFKADEQIKAIEEELKQVQYHLDHIVDYTIDYYATIQKKFGADYPRMTEIRSFDNIEATKVAVANEKLYINYEEGFAGTGLKKDEYISDCSDIDDIIVFRKDGTYFITKVTEKTFVGKGVIHIAVFLKNDKRTIYNVVYRDGQTGTTFLKRFFVTGVTRDKEYDLTKGTPNSRIIYFSANPNGEAETIKITLKPRPRLKKLSWEQEFSEIAIKGRSAMGNMLSKNPVHKIVMKEKGVSTLGGRKLWFDFDVMRLNNEERGTYLGEFKGDDKLLVMNKSGEFRTVTPELTTHFENDVVVIEKYSSNKVFSVVFYEGELKFFYLKRFIPEDTERPQSYIGENTDSYMKAIYTAQYPRIMLKFGGNDSKRDPETIDVNEFISVKSFKARGKRLTTYELAAIEELEPLIKDEILEDDNMDEESQQFSDEPDFEIIRPTGDEEQTSLDLDE